jgi:hypothetical protein
MHLVLLPKWLQDRGVPVWAAEDVGARCKALTFDNPHIHSMSQHKHH